MVHFRSRGIGLEQCIQLMKNSRNGTIWFHGEREKNTKLFFYHYLRDTRPELIAHIKEQTFDFKVVSFRDSRDYQVEGVDRDGRTRVHKITKFWAITDKDLRAGNRIVKQKGNTTLTIIQPDTIRRFPLSFSDGDEVW